MEIKFFKFWPAAWLVDVSSLIRDGTQDSAVKVVSANHWNTREFPQLLLKRKQVGTVPMPGRGTKIPYPMWCSQKLKKNSLWAFFSTQTKRKILMLYNLSKLSRDKHFTKIQT